MQCKSCGSVSFIPSYQDILCDGPVAQSLGVEQVDADVMNRPPRSKQENMINSAFIKRTLVNAMVMVVGILFVYIQESVMLSSTASRVTTMASCYLRLILDFYCLCLV